MSPQRPVPPRSDRVAPGRRPATPVKAPASPARPAQQPASAHGAPTPATKPAQKQVPAPTQKPAGKPSRTLARTPATTSAATSPGQPAGRSGPQPARQRTAATAVAPASTATEYGARRWGGLPVRPAVVSTTSAARFAERVRARRRLTARRATIAGSATVAALALAWLTMLSPVLALDPVQVQVTGAGAVVAMDQVEALVAERAGTPLPRLDTVGLATALRDVPGVREAEVSRDWPHGLVIALVAREPVAAVPAEGGVVLLDAEGVQVGRADVAPEGLPVVDVPVGDALTLGAVLEVLRQMPPELLAEIATVSAGSRDTVAFELRSGARVEWGSAQDTPLKIAVLQTLRTAPATAGASVFDVSAPTLPITR